MSKMTGTTLTAPLAQIETPLLAVALAQGGAVPASLAELDRATGGVVARAITSGDFKGKRDETALLYPSGAKPQRLLLVGLGKTGEVTRAGIRRAAAVAAKRARALGATQFTFALAAEARNGIAAADVGQVVVEGSAQGAWAFTEVKAVGAGERLGEAIAAGHFLTRYLQMLPGNVCTPAYLADRAKQLADLHGFTCSVLDRAQMRQENMGALLAVAQGSQQEPRFIVLEYRGAGAADPPVALVGKGVTFDSGGISIKPAQNMEDMKFDMSGAAAVLGTFEALGRLKPRLNVVGVIPSTENLPSGTAVKPGDVVKSHLGKTIEIINTDAEGRLILCDALSYVKRFKPVAGSCANSRRASPGCTSTSPERPTPKARGRTRSRVPPRSVCGSSPSSSSSARGRDARPRRRRKSTLRHGATPPSAIPPPAIRPRVATARGPTPSPATSRCSPRGFLPAPPPAARATASPPTRSPSRTSRRCPICWPTFPACTWRGVGSTARRSRCCTADAGRRGSSSIGTASPFSHWGAIRCTSTRPASRSRRSSAWTSSCSRPRCACTSSRCASAPRRSRPRSASRAARSVRRTTAAPTCAAGT